ncbi:MAG: molecular chaperone HtpG [Lachnospiraceae bacterium]|nr:molecular chaperone HtpG [Lachnospiraceae bacterium]
MATEKGNLSISSENIFPIIKKWLYNDQDIFVREMISNGCDAITKLRKLEIMGEYQFPEENHFEIQVVANPTKKTLSFIDNGIGMTAEEVKEYINNIAFSGATDFLEKYKDKANDDQIIGHFGLGFYSAFMVADKVTIDTLSYQEGAKAVHWECDGGTEFEMSDSDKENVGTEVTLYLNENCYEYSNEYRVKEVLNKYCSFMPEEIYFVNTDTIGKEQPKKEGAEGEAQEPEEPKPLNDPHPLWTKHPNDCSKEDYIDFYRKVFNDYKEPLFWIHLNMDYPFNLKGILYFPRLNNSYDTLEGTIKLYNNQVFIADNIKEVIPEFLMLLKGVIDCPDLPLNVSRSALQNDGFVTKISDYITKKVADKLSGMYKVEKEEYEKYWDDISPFIKFGCLRDTKFAEKMNDYVLFRNLDDKYLTFKEALEENQEKHENTIFYISDRVQQARYIEMFKKAKIDAVYLEHMIDSAYIQQLEMKNEGVKFLRIDTNLDKAFTKRTSKKDQEVLDEKAEKIQERLRKLKGNDKIEVKLQNLKNAETSSVLTVSEEQKRMEDMMMQMGMMGMDHANLEQFKSPGTLVLNNNNELVQYVIENIGEEADENADLMLEQLYDLAKLGNEPLTAEEMSKFIARSNKIMVLLAK